MTQNSPIVFEIAIKNEQSPFKSPAIQQKLEELSSHAAAPPTYEDIEKKQKKAEQRRLERLNR